MTSRDDPGPDPAPGPDESLAPAPEAGPDHGVSPTVRIALGVDATGPGATNEHRHEALPVGDHELELLVDRLWSLGATGVAETRVDATVEVVAGFDDAVAARHAVDALGHLGARMEQASPDAWVQHWRVTQRPVVVGPITVRLPEHPPPTTSSSGAKGPTTDLVIEPGSAFGYAHATTRCCLAALPEVIEHARRIGGCAVADVGCGTGVLAIAAAALGATTVTAVDIDAEAVETTRANAERNGARIDVALGSVEHLAAATFDVVIANVTAGVLLSLADGLVAATRPGGTLLLSGMLADQVDRVVDTIGDSDEIERTFIDGWAGVRLRRRSHGNRRRGSPRPSS